MTISPKICTVDGCDTKTLCRGYCNRHYLQMQRHGRILEKTIYEKRPAIIEGTVCKLPLGFSDEYALVDESFSYLDVYKWSKGANGYPQANIGGKTTVLHWVILQGEGVTDHINRNKLDNRCSNLRVCTPSQNSANIQSPGSKSGFRGVHAYGVGGKWFVKVSTKYCGSFDNIIDAAKEYDKRAIERWGEYAILNF